MNNSQNNLSQKKLTAYEVQVKLENWCAYQERSQKEVRFKLKDFKLEEVEMENIIAHLIESNFLNEERFADAYTRGKFRIKKWGKNKIKQELKLKGVSDYCIKKSLLQISDEEYFSTLESVIEKRMKSIKESNQIKKKFKLINYCFLRGFEQDLVVEMLSKIEKKL